MASAQSRTCEACGRPLGPSPPGGAASDYCLECAVEVAESRLYLEDAAPTEAPAASPEERRRIRVRTALAAVSLLVMAIAIAWPTIGPVSGYEPPPRTGAASTDVTADECIENVAILLELGTDGETGEDLECPASNTAYRVTWTDEEEPELLEAACPTPDAHGLAGIAMAAGDLFPTVSE